MKKGQFKIVEGGICAPHGFAAAGLSCGIKKSPPKAGQAKKKDLALIYSTFPSSAAGVFTTNKVKAAPIIVSQKIIKSGSAQAIVINSGNANACCGQNAMKDAVSMIKETAAAFRLREKDVLVASTGIIGTPLPMKKIVAGIWTASRMINKNGGADAAEAILTTDLCKKEISIEMSFGKDRVVRVGGIAKGSGMICPNMATMMAILTTDAKIEPKLLQKALNEAVADSFNMITVDNDMSTNDCVFILANGRSEKITGGENYKLFLEELKYVCTCLAKEIARDGEGATKLISICVKGAKTMHDACLAAKTIAGSNLFKCAVFGADPNFGRILAAVGYSGANIDPDKIDIFVDNMQLVKRGSAISFDAVAASNSMKKEEVDFIVNLNQGKFCATAWGCDMTEGYIKINTKYHT